MSYTDFKNCPVCEGDPDGLYDDDSTFSPEKPCAACSGSGERVIDEAAINLALSAADWLKEHVAEVFSDYCKTFKIFHAYGVDSWEVRGDTLVIVQDVSCRGCRDTTDHRLPVRYFYADAERRRAMMVEDATTKKRAQDEQERRDKEARLRRHEEEAARLRQELET